MEVFCYCSAHQDCSRGAELGCIMCAQAEIARLSQLIVGCICKGNWRLIVSEMEPLFGKKYTRNGKEYTLSGVVHASDDYYYLMVENNGVAHLASCVGALTGESSHGYTLLTTQ